MSLFFLFNEMKGEYAGLQPNIETYNLLIEKCSLCGMSDEAKFIFTNMCRQGLIPNDNVYLSLIRCSRNWKEIEIYTDKIRLKSSRSPLFCMLMDKIGKSTYQPELRVQWLNSFWISNSQLSKDINAYSKMLECLVFNHDCSLTLTILNELKSKLSVLNPSKNELEKAFLIYGNQSYKEEEDIQELISSILSMVDEG